VCKLYLRKHNFNSKPFILEILLAEIDEVVEFIKSALAQIGIGIESKQYPFKADK
jgi:hypothetical protein